MSTFYTLIFISCVFVIVKFYSTFQRKWFNFNSIKSVKSDLNALRKNAITVQELSQNLPVKYSELELEIDWSLDSITFDFFQDLNNLQVVHLERTLENKVFLITLSRDYDLDLSTRNGNNGVEYVEFIYAINYLIAKEDYKLVVYSDYAQIGIEKSLRIRFGKLIHQRLIRKTLG